MRVYLGKVISSFFPWDLPFFFPDGNVLAAAGHSSRYFYLALISFVLCNLLHLLLYLTFVLLGFSSELAFALHSFITSFHDVVHPYLII